MLRIVRGDRHAFRIIVERYQGPMYNFFLRSGSITEDAEDLTQQLFIKLFNASYQTRHKATFRSFIYRMATNLLIDHARKRGSDRLVFNDDIAEGLQELISPGEDLPDRNMEAAQLRDRYSQALEKLPREWKIVMELRVTGELSYKEIAESTRLSVPAAIPAAFRALHSRNSRRLQFSETFDC